MYGYYIFLGRGDWGSSRTGALDPTFGGNVQTRLLGDWGPHRCGTPLSRAPEWSSAWDLATWKRRIDVLVDPLGADTLCLLMNGFELPYPSRRFPEAVEKDHALLRHDFLQDLLDYARTRGLTLVAQFCTTGHAETYAAVHPDFTTVAADGTRHPTNLCHHHPGGRDYAMGVTREVLTRYQGFAGVSFHPPENSVPCSCPYCRRAFAIATGAAWDTATPDDIRRFHWASCLAFQHEMEDLARSLVPGVQVFSVTIPGQFERDFGAIAPQIPLSTTFLHWDYWTFGEQLPALVESLRLFRSRGHRVGFIPSSGWSLDKCGVRYGEAVLGQIAAVRQAGVEDLLYFVGAIWHEASLRATSWRLHVPEAQGGTP